MMETPRCSNELLCCSAALTSCSAALGNSFHTDILVIFSCGPIFHELFLDICRRCISSDHQKPLQPLVVR